MVSLSLGALADPVWWGGVHSIKAVRERVTLDLSNKEGIQQCVKESQSIYDSDLL